MYIGIRAHRPQWLAWSAFYFGLLAAFMAVDAPTHPSSSAQAIATGCILAAWIGGGVHAAAISGSAVRRIDEYSDPAFKAGRPPLEAAKARIKRRAKGRKLLARQPQLAREVGLGRPDLPGTEDYGLVDVNHASQAALRMLPGVTEDAAQKIVSMRTELGGFSSAEDLGAALDLPPAMVDEMREVAVFL
jgi:DNA uptake protein ComE-like DNA-binding protein